MEGGGVEGGGAEGGGVEGGAEGGGVEGGGGGGTGRAPGGITSYTENAYSKTKVTDNTTHVETRQGREFIFDTTIKKVVIYKGKNKHIDVDHFIVNDDEEISADILNI